jgi:hypothetical protein
VQTSIPPDAKCLFHRNLPLNYRIGSEERTQCGGGPSRGFDRGDAHQLHRDDPPAAGAYGFDSQTGEYVNLITKGIIDPTKVVRVAIQNAASVAALLITTEAMVAEAPKKNAGGGMPPGGGGMGGMDF